MSSDRFFSTRFCGGELWRKRENRAEVVPSPRDERVDLWYFKDNNSGISRHHGFGVSGLFRAARAGQPTHHFGSVFIRWEMETMGVKSWEELLRRHAPEREIPAFGSWDGSPDRRGTRIEGVVEAD